MTFSIVGRCARTGQFGIAIATGAPAVGSRCVWARAGAGAVATQSYTNMRLGPLGLRLLSLGYSAEKALKELVEADPHVHWRQLGVVDRDGNSAAFTGDNTRAWTGHRTGPNYSAQGNAISGEAVVTEMVRLFETTEEYPLDERLLEALEAGHAAGGQPDGEISAALYIVDREEFPIVDLRVDDHPQAIAELRRIYAAYIGLTDYNLERITNPSAMPPWREWLERKRAVGSRQ